MGEGLPAGRLCCCRVAAEQRSRSRASGLQCCADPGTLVSLAWRRRRGGLVAESAATTQSSGCIGVPLGCHPTWGAAPAFRWEWLFLWLMLLGDASRSQSLGREGGSEGAAGFGALRGPGNWSGMEDRNASSTLWLMPVAPRMVYWPGVGPGMLQGRVFKALGRISLRVVMILAGFG